MSRWGLRAIDCCGLEAISASLKETSDEEREALCREYDGGVCDCEFADETMMCVEQRCTMVAN